MKTVKKHRMSYERTKALAGFLFILPWVIGFVFIVAKSLALIVAKIHERFLTHLA